LVDQTLPDESCTDVIAPAALYAYVVTSAGFVAPGV